MPGLSSPSRELPGQAGTITPPPNQIRPGSSSADWGLLGGRGGGCFESQKLFSLSAPNRPQNFSLQRPPGVAEPSLSPSGSAAGHAGSAAAGSALRPQRVVRAPRHPRPSSGPSRPRDSVMVFHLPGEPLKNTPTSLLSTPTQLGECTSRLSMEPPSRRQKLQDHAPAWTSFTLHISPHFLNLHCCNV